MKVPFVDLKIQYKHLKNQIDSAISNVINNTSFIKGEDVKKFETDFAEMHSIKNCISVANGTDALFIAQKMLGIGPGDEVIVPALSWISTSETVSLTGATPVFVDIDYENFTIDVSKIEDQITNKTKAIIPVHIYGQCADMDPILSIAHKSNIKVIEDTAQAHFAKYKNEYAGTMGDIGVFSFYPGKNLGAYGDAGAIITNNDEIANNCRMFANHGSIVKHNHVVEGMNSRMDGIQAAVLNVKLDYIHDWNLQRQKNAQKYIEKLKSYDFIELPKIAKTNEHVFHVFCIKTKKAEELKEFLFQNNIETQVHYPTFLPFLEAYEYLEQEVNDLRVSKEIQGNILSLPMYPELSEDQIDFVVEKIVEFHS